MPGADQPGGRRVGRAKKATAALAPNLDPVLGLPGFRDVARIGQGGFSVVYQAYQERFDRRVAVKVLSFDPSDPQAWKRFRRECELTGRLSGHPNIVHVPDSGETALGRPYLLMDYFDKGSLADRIRSVGPLNVEEILRLGVKLCGALESAHRAGVLHRDLKPENVLLSRYEPALADFGIAGLVSGGGMSMLAGAMTPVHAPPEILDSKPGTEASDIYSMGSTLYAALAGRPAFSAAEGESLLAVQVRILRDDPPPIGRGDVPAELEEVLRQAMAKEPHRRLASAAALGERLRSLQGLLNQSVTELVVDHAARPPAAAPEDRRPCPGPAPPGVLPGAPGSAYGFERTPTVVVPNRRSPDADPVPDPHPGLPKWVRWASVGLACLLAAGALVAILGRSKTSKPKAIRNMYARYAPSDLTISGVTSTQLTLSWTDPGTTKPGVAVTWLSGTQRQKTTGVPDGETSNVFTGLQPDQESWRSSMTATRAPSPSCGNTTRNGRTRHELRLCNLRAGALVLHVPPEPGQQTLVRCRHPR